MIALKLILKGRLDGVIGIRNGAAGMVHLYDQKVQGNRNGSWEPWAWRSSPPFSPGSWP